MDFTGIALVLGVAYVASIFVSFQKGKKTFGWLGLTGLIPIVSPFLIWFPIVGAVRTAKPDSAWAKSRYGPTQMSVSRQRFGGPPPAPTSASMAANAPAGPGGQGAAPQQTDGTGAHVIVVRFLEDARSAGVINDPTFRRLITYVAKQAPASVPEASRVKPETAAKPSGPVRTPPILPNRTPRAAVASSPQRPIPRSAEPPPSASKPTAPPPSPPSPKPAAKRPSRIATAASDIWGAVVSDVAIHGFAYLGVLLTFVGVLGFLLFAFVDVDDAAQPFVELFIAAVFFGWAWVLRKQGALRVAQGMEMVGGMVLPLILFAGLVDGAPIPPDFTGRSAVVALPLTAVLMSAVYWMIFRRNPRSTLRYLVGPLWWLAALALGFAFKTDEPLFSDAIARLVSPQPAMATVAIAVTLAIFALSRRHPLTAPTMRSATVGLPVAYLLTISLSVGERWERTVPIIVLGAATVVSAELLAKWFNRTNWIALFRPLLVAVALVPLVPLFGAGWSGLVFGAAYVLLFEVNERSGRLRLARYMDGLGIAAGAAMSLLEPAAALVTFSGLAVWSHVHRAQDGVTEEARSVYTLLAAVLPIGSGWAIHVLLGPEVGWFVMALIAATIAVGARRLRSHDDFWPYWLTAAGLAVMVGSQAAWLGSDGTSVAAVAGVALAVVPIAVSPRWPVARLWAGWTVGALALADALATFEAPQGARGLIWSVLGLALVIVGNSWRRLPASHIIAIGHLVGAVGFAFSPNEAVRAVVLATWAAGWVLTVIGDERGGDNLRAVINRALGRDGTEENQAGDWAAPVFMAISVPIAVLAVTHLVPWVAATRSATGAILGAVALALSAVARWLVSRRPLPQVLSTAAVAASIIGVAVAAPDAWLTAFACASLIGVASLISGDVRKPWFVWVAWLASVALVLLLANRAGVGSESLHYVSLIWGAVTLGGGLALDNRRRGRRSPGEGLRERSLRYPVLLGALLFPASLGIVFSEPVAVFAWWSIAAAAFYMLVAIQLRAGLVTVPAYGLAALGFTALTSTWMLDHPWRLVFVAGPLVAVSWLGERYQAKEYLTSFVLRWDLAPLVVAHVIGAFALVAAAGNGTLFTSALAFGILSVVIGIWKRRRVWAEIGNIMVLAAAYDAGTEWLAVALGATAIRGIIGVRFSSGWARMSYQVIGTVAAGSGWLAFLSARGIEGTVAVNLSAMAFAVLALVLAVWGRIGRLGVDTARSWGTLAVVAVAGAGVVAIMPDGPGLEGGWFSGSLVILAIALEMAANRVGRSLRDLAVASVGVAWFALAVGMGWDSGTSLDYSALFFGAVALVAALLARVSFVDRPGLIRWTGLGAAGVGITTVLVFSDNPANGPWLAAGTALLGIGFELGAVVVDRRLRLLTVAAAGAAWVALVTGMGWDADLAMPATTAVFGAIAVTVPEVVRWRDRQGADIWMDVPATWGALGAAGLLITALVAPASGRNDAGYWIGAGLGLLSLAAARAARPMGRDWLRETAAVTALGSLTGFAFGADPSGSALAPMLIVGSVAVTFASLRLWVQAPASDWYRPLILFAGLANLEALALALRELPQDAQLAGVLLSGGVQLIGFGIVRERPAALAAGPPLLASAFILGVAGAVSGGSAQWYTVPVGLVVLAEVEVLLSWRRRRDEVAYETLDVMVLEWIGVGLMAAPALVEMFTRGLWYGLFAFLASALLLLWAIVTRVKRRAVTAASTAIATSVLLLFAAAAGSAPDSAFVWIVAVGIGFAVMLVAALVEAYRNKKGMTMLRLDQLMEGWK